jgi:hypothetical protein
MKIAILFLLFATRVCCASVRVEAVPEGGVQPQVAVDEKGTAHLIYLKGEAKGCDVRYARRAGGGTWSAPVTVNSIAGSAVAMGTIRGAQLALGRGGAVHVVWNGTRGAGGHEEGSPLFYSRLEPGASKFTEQRNLLEGTRALDGGASVTAADEKVFVVWHGQKAGAEQGERGRVVFVAKSTDGGRTFGTPVVANADFTGTCACCSLKAMTTGRELFILYRAAHETVDRDMTLLWSADDGATFERKTLGAWKTERCPMSSATLLQTPQGIRGAWETDGKIFSTTLPAAVEAAELAGGSAKHPVLATNRSGEMLAVWTTGTGWNRGGALGWSLLDAHGKPSGKPGSTTGVPVWSHAAVYAEQGGDFVVLR